LPLYGSGVRQERKGDEGGPVAPYAGQRVEPDEVVEQAPASERPDQDERADERRDHERQRHEHPEEPPQRQVGPHHQPRQRGAQHGAGDRGGPGEQQRPRERAQRRIGPQDVEGVAAFLHRPDDEVDERTGEGGRHDQADDDQGPRWPRPEATDAWSGRERRGRDRRLGDDGARHPRVTLARGRFAR
jgi:hypothetical protein